MLTAKFEFKKHPNKATRYTLEAHLGDDVPEFPAQWRIGPEKGTYYVGYRATVNHKVGHRLFTHTIELAGGRIVTGINFPVEYPRLSWGDFGGYAILVRFSEDWKNLTMFFFKDMKDTAQSIFQRWVAGELSEVPEKKALPLPIPALAG